MHLNRVGCYLPASARLVSVFKICCEPKQGYRLGANWKRQAPTRTICTESCLDPPLMLGQCCLRALLGEQFNFTQSGFKMGFCPYLEMRPKVGKKGGFGCKSGSNGSKPTLLPTWNPFWDIGKNPLFAQFLGHWQNPLFAQFQGARNCFPKRALKQSRPSITLPFCHAPTQNHLDCLIRAGSVARDWLS